MRPYVEDPNSDRVISVLCSLIRKLLAWEGTTNLQMLGLARVLHVLARFPKPTPGTSAKVILHYPAGGIGDSRLLLAWDITVSEDGIGASICGSISDPETGPDSLTVVEWEAFPGEVISFNDYSMRLGMADLPNLDPASLETIDLSEPGYKLEIIDFDQGEDAADPTMGGCSGSTQLDSQEGRRVGWQWLKGKKSLSIRRPDYGGTSRRLQLGEIIAFLINMCQSERLAVKEMNIDSYPISDNLLFLVGNLFPNLEVLRWNYSQDPDPIATSPALFSGLGHLDFFGTKISSDLSNYLSGMKKLEYLDLGATSLTNKDIVHVARLKKLKFLGLGYNGTGVSDNELALVAKLTNLEKLDLTSTAITDSGLRDLASLSRLKSLGLAENFVSAVGLRALACLPAIGRLDVEQTLVTPEEGTQLASEFPNRIQILASPRVPTSQPEQDDFDLPF